MRKYLAFATFLFLLTGFSYENETFPDEAKILKAIQQLCLDVWCENSNDFWFKKLVFNKEDNSTKVIFDMGPRIFPFKVEDNKYFHSSIDQKKFLMQCTIKGYSNTQSLIDPNGRLNKSFKESLSDCILSLELQIMSVASYKQPNEGVFLDWT
jgi:hypothetical protein